MGEPNVVEVEMTFEPSVFKGLMDWPIPPKAHWLATKLKMAGDERRVLRVDFGFLYDSEVFMGTFEMFQVLALIEHQLVTHIDYDGWQAWWIPMEQYEEWLQKRQESNEE